MSLRVELSPNERVLISGACVRNTGSLKIYFFVENHTKVLRGKYLISESEADTPCKRLHFFVQGMYLTESKPDISPELFELAHEISMAVEGSSAFLKSVYDSITAVDFYRALKTTFALLEHEANRGSAKLPSMFVQKADVKYRRIELSPNESLLLGDTSISNGERRSRLEIDAGAKMIPGKYIMLDREADTPCKRLYVLLEHLYLAAEPEPYRQKFAEASLHLALAAPRHTLAIEAIAAAVAAKNFHQAMAASRQLIRDEAVSFEGVDNLPMAVNLQSRSQIHRGVP